MRRLLSTPDFPDEARRRKARLLMSVVRTMLVMGSLGVLVSYFDSSNSLAVGIVFYGVAFAVTLGLAQLVQSGRLELAAWIMSGWFWTLLAFVTLFFGGLKGTNSAVFAVSIILVGVVVGGRSAIVLAGITSAWCLFIAVLEIKGWMPPQLGPYSPINAWTAVTVTLVLVSVLLKSTLDSLEEEHRRADLAARERDEALRHSIQSQKLELVGRITSGIAHDLNNLLAVITSSVALLPSTGREDPEVASTLDDLNAATERAALVTRQLLSFGRRTVEEPQIVSLREALLQFEPLAQRLAGAGVTVRVTVGGACAMFAARSGVEQVLLNLTTNAIEAMPQGGTLSFRLSERDGQVVLEVEDTGVGMDEATRASAFEPFFTTKARGTGLGLATVKDVVDRFRGTLSCVSAPGSGTRFALSFPCVAQAQQVVLKPAEPHPASVGRVLVVDDDTLVRRATARLLESLGYEVITVESAEEALALLEAKAHVEVVVSDIVMPGMSGEQLAAQLAVQHPELPVVLMSGNRAPSPEVMRSPRRGFLPKPSSREALKEAIRLAMVEPVGQMKPELKARA